MGVTNELIRYFDMFAGIGGFRAGLDRAGGFQCAGHCEIDKFADASYRAIHDVKKEECYYPDAREIDPVSLPPFDLICAGFPCQPFSSSGQKRGFADARGTLFFEIARLAEARRPSYLLLENVPGLLFHDKGRTFEAILKTLHDMGYGLEWMVLNSKHFGVPQSRRRIYLVGYLDARCAGKIFPLAGTGGKALIQLQSGRRGKRIYDSKGIACTQTAQTGGMGGKTGLYFVDSDTSASFVDLCAGHPVQTGTARCITARYGQTTLSNHRGERSGVLLIKENTKKGCKEAAPGDTVSLGFRSCLRRRRVRHSIAHTLDTGSTQGISGVPRRSPAQRVRWGEEEQGSVCSLRRQAETELSGLCDDERHGRIRRLTPRECLRLQGFAEDQIDRLLAITSDSQAYKQAGNSVTVPVVEAVGRRLREADEALKKEDAGA